MSNYFLVNIQESKAYKIQSHRSSQPLPSSPGITVMSYYSIENKRSFINFSLWQYKLT